MSGIEMTAEAVVDSGARHRITFATSRTLAYVSVLDLGRIWERSLRRARIPVRYSQGFNRRPKMQFAAPLPTGCGGEAEWLDVWLDEPWPPHSVSAALQGHMPENLKIVDVALAPSDAPPLSEEVIAAAYRILLRDVPFKDVQAAAQTLMSAEQIMRPRRGRRRGKDYDLRPLVETLELTPSPAPWGAMLHMRLTARPGATGRPDEVLGAMGFGDVPRRCVREQLIVQHATPENT